MSVELSISAPSSEVEEISSLFFLFSHPLRLRMAIALLPGGRQSATSLSEQFEDVDVGHCYYHLVKLANGGVIELADSRKVRGATERIYRMTPPARWPGINRAKGLAEELERANKRLP
jgi:hypothetical protein